MPQPGKQPPDPASARHADRKLDRDLDDTFPASDPVASEQRVAARSPKRDPQDHGILTTPTDRQKADARKQERDRDDRRDDRSTRH